MRSETELSVTIRRDKNKRGKTDPDGGRSNLDEERADWFCEQVGVIETRDHPCPSIDRKHEELSASKFYEVEEGLLLSGQCELLS